MIQICINSIELNTLNLFYETLLEISFKIKTPTVLNAVQSFPLSSPSVKLEESWSLKKFSTIFFVKKYAFELYVN